jgi:plasmid stabilization system protein ParE
VAKIVFSVGAAEQVQKIREFYRAREWSFAERAMKSIFASLRVLSKRVETGRPLVEAPGLREHVVPFGKQGFVVLYRYDEDFDRVVILALRHQREAGFGDPRD